MGGTSGGLAVAVGVLWCRLVPVQHASHSRGFELSAQRSTGEATARPQCRETSQLNTDPLGDLRLATATQLSDRTIEFVVPQAWVFAHGAQCICLHKRLQAQT